MPNENVEAGQVAGTQQVALARPKTYDVFISYRRGTGLDLARSIAYWFRANGFKCFIDQTELKTGQFNKQIYKAIEETQYFLLLVTENALERCVNDGDWVRKEIEYASSKGVTIIPLTPMPDYAKELPAPGRLPESLEFLRRTEASQFDRQKNFESTLQEMVKRQMPLFKGRVNFAEKDKEDRLFLSIRHYKRNDGTIDKQERQQLESEAREYGIEERLQNMINHVEEEWGRERNFVKWAVNRFQLTDGKLTKTDVDELQKRGEASRIMPDRQGELIIEIEQKISQNVAKKENEEVKACLEKVRKAYEDTKKDLEGVRIESARRSRKCKALWGLLLISFILVIAVWFHGRSVGGGDAHGYIAKETARLKAEMAELKADSENMKAEAEKARLEAVKREAAAATAKEMADRAIKDMKTKLETAVSSAKASGAARQEAEKRMAEVSAKLAAEQAAFQRARKAIESNAADERKRLEDRAASAESARQLAENKLSSQTADIKHLNEKVNAMEEENKRLRNEVDEARRQKPGNALRDI